jgi:hypothetical protein
MRERPHTTMHTRTRTLSFAFTSIPEARISAITTGKCPLRAARCSAAIPEPCAPPRLKHQGIHRVAQEGRRCCRAPRAPGDIRASADTSSVTTHRHAHTEECARRRCPCHRRTHTARVAAARTACFAFTSMPSARISASTTDRVPWFAAVRSIVHPLCARRAHGYRPRAPNRTTTHATAATRGHCTSAHFHPRPHSTTQARVTAVRRYKYKYKYKIYL